MLNARRGFTLVEALVAMFVGSLVLGMLATISARQQRFYRDIADAAARAEQLQQTEALLPVDVRAIAPGEGDIPAGSARDTALQFRATIASAVVCDTAGQSVSLAPAVFPSGVPDLWSQMTAPEAGDTAWSLTLSDTGESWAPHPITSVATDHGGCVIGGVDTS